MVLKRFAAAALLASPVSLAIAYDVPYAPTGIVSGQTLRLTVVNITPKTLPTGPCVATLGFVDSNGRSILTGNSYTKSVTLTPGASTFVDVSAPSGAIGPGGRVSVRPVVGTSTIACLFRVSAVVLDGSANVVVASPQDPILPAGPLGLLNLYGLKWVGPAQYARFSVVNLSRSSITGDSCTVKLSFVNDTGQPVVNADGQQISSQVSLAPGSTSSLDAYSTPATPGAVAIRPVVQRVNPPGTVNPQCVLASGSEVIDRVTGATTAYQPQDPILPQDPFTPRP